MLLVLYFSMKTFLETYAYKWDGQLVLMTLRYVRYVICRINDLTNCLRACVMKCCQSSSSFQGRFPFFPIPPFLSIQTIWWIGTDILSKITMCPFIYYMLWIWWNVMPVAQSPSADKLLLSCNTELSFCAWSKWPVACWRVIGKIL